MRMCRVRSVKQPGSNAGDGSRCCHSISRWACHIHLNDEFIDEDKK